MLRIYTLVATLFLLGTLNAHAQCTVLRGSLNAFFYDSELVIEAKVIGQETFHDKTEQYIYTRHYLEVYKLFKGRSSSVVELITLGGTNGNEAMQVSGALQLEPGQAGVFLLKTYSGRLLEPVDRPLYRPVAGGASFISYRPDWGAAYSTGQIYSSLDELYHELEHISGKAYNELIPAEQNIQSRNPAVINGIEPPIANAGVDDTVAIKGHGFGEVPGTIFFSNADNGGLGYTSTFPWHIVSWKDGLIEVKVPHKAGTGDLIVLGGGSVAFSSEELDIQYAHTNVLSASQFYQPQLVDDEEADGGYRFTFSDNASGGGVPFLDQEGAYEALIRAAGAWQDSVGAPIYFGRDCPGTHLQSPGSFNDGVNLISFDSDSWDMDEEVSAYTLAVTISRYAKCEGTDWEVVDVDIIIRRDGNPNGYGGAVDWAFSEEGPAEGQIDFQTVMVHELGHVLQLQHVVDETAVMHYSTTYGQVKRELGLSDDQAGASYVLNHSTNYEPPQISCWPAEHFESERPLRLYDESVSCESDTVELENLATQPVLNEWQLMIYPNPLIGGNLTVDFLAVEEGRGRLNILDMAGREYSTTPLWVTEGYNKVDVSSTGLVPGVYLVLLQLAQGQKVEKLVVKQ